MPEVWVVLPVKVMFLDGVSFEKQSVEGTVAVPSSSGPPTLTDDKVACVGEADRVAVVGGREVDVAAGLVVLVVVLTAGEVVRSDLKVRGVGAGGRGSEGAGNGRSSDGEVSESNHDRGRDVLGLDALHLGEDARVLSIFIDISA